MQFRVFVDWLVLVGLINYEENGVGSEGGEQVEVHESNEPDHVEDGDDTYPDAAYYYDYVDDNGDYYVNGTLPYNNTGLYPYGFNGTYEYDMSGSGSGYYDLGTNGTNYGDGQYNPYDYDGEVPEYIYSLLYGL
ncbi:protein E30A [Proboscivirus elephantidbeta4]|uniref:Protein E30A n=1 Tax=Elephant endotheliotropic herpesvirus 4 TaxID=548914 RepID=A0A0S1TPW2_9BETA|nr:protein E30A [Elephant endotheliotropic herpesvirus 4]ALM26040.1 protein E30A [Elephant endotheliotropic herpesvirus 4]